MTSDHQKVALTPFGRVVTRLGDHHTFPPSPLYPYAGSGQPPEPARLISGLYLCVHVKRKESPSLVPDGGMGFLITPHLIDPLNTHMRERDQCSIDQVKRER